MGLAGITPPAEVEGIDLLRRAQDVPELAFAHCADADVVRSIEYKLIDFDLSELRKRGKRLPEEFKDGIKFYVLRSDPREEIDAKEARPEQLQKMQSALDGYRAALGREPVRLADSGTGIEPKTRERLRVLGYDSPQAAAVAPK
jgi:hypothetical protein